MGAHRQLPLIPVSSGCNPAAAGIRAASTRRDSHRSPVHSPEAPADCPAPLSDGTRALVDQFGRVASDLRVSLTDKCNLRCTYCMPAEGLPWIPTPECLTDEEVIRLITIAVEQLRVTAIRFTGGEPLLRKSLPAIVAATAALKTYKGQRPQIALTTNGLGLDKHIGQLVAAGLQRVNISLDSLDPVRYHQLTRRDRLADALAGIEAARHAGLDLIKLNAVVMKDVNEDDVLPLVRFSVERGLQLRFIEQMPLGPRGRWERDSMVTADDIFATLRAHAKVTRHPSPRGSAPADLFDIEFPDGAQGTIGIIASVTRPFCGDCDRTRLTTDGAIRSCLFSHHELSLRDHLRAGASDAELAALWAGEMWQKKAGHGINDPHFLQPDRGMSAIGG